MNKIGHLSPMITLILILSLAVAVLSVGFSIVERMGTSEPICENIDLRAASNSPVCYDAVRRQIVVDIRNTGTTTITSLSIEIETSSGSETVSIPQSRVRPRESFRATYSHPGNILSLKLVPSVQNACPDKILQPSRVNC